MIVAYKEYRARALEDNIDIRKEEFERRVAVRKEQLGDEGAFWEKTSPELTDAIAQSHVRSEMAKELSLLSFEEFRTRELPQIGERFQLDPSEFGGESIPPQPTG
jgi:hypothetical protein